MDSLVKIIANHQPEAARGRRLARFFAMLVLKENPQIAADVKNPIAPIKDAADSWIKDYPNALKTPEGFGVRYIQAWAMFTLIEQLKPPPSEIERNRHV